MPRGVAPSNADQAEGKGGEELSQGVLFPVLGACGAGSGLHDTISGMQLSARLFTPLPLPDAPAGQQTATMTPAPETTLTLQVQQCHQKNDDNYSFPPK